MELVEIIRDYWHIILSVLSFIVFFALLKFQNEDQEKRIKCLEDEVRAINPLFMEIKERLASIEATLKILTK